MCRAKVEDHRKLHMQHLRYINIIPVRDHISTLESLRIRKR